MLSSSGRCTDSGLNIVTAEACFSAATTVGINATSLANKTVQDPALPDACSIMTQPDGSAVVYFNTGGEAVCSGRNKKVGQMSAVGVEVALELDFAAGSVTI